MSVKKILVGVSTCAVMLSLMAVPAFAAPGTDPNPNGNDSGLTYPYTVPGYDSARDNSVCADHGAFGYYAHGGIPVSYETPRAADGYETGVRNSTLCGNRQGNL